MFKVFLQLTETLLINLLDFFEFVLFETVVVVIRFQTETNMSDTMFGIALGWMHKIKQQIIQIREAFKNPCI